MAEHDHATTCAREGDIETSVVVDEAHAAGGIGSYHTEQHVIGLGTLAAVDGAYTDGAWKPRSTDGVPDAHDLGGVLTSKHSVIEEDAARDDNIV